MNELIVKIIMLSIVVYVLMITNLYWNGFHYPKYSLHTFCVSHKNKFKHLLFNVPLNKEVCHENLAIIHKVFAKHNVFFWLSEGTALGFTRDNDFISHDDDVDIGTMIENRETIFTKILPELKRYGFVHHGLPISKYKNYIGLIRNNEKIDIDIVDPKGYCLSNINKCSKVIPYLKNFNKKIIRGKIYNIPSEDYLVYLYGKNWRIPIKNYKGHDHSSPGYFNTIIQYMWDISKKVSK
jgi:hypothetical protein